MSTGKDPDHPDAGGHGKHRTDISRATTTEHERAVEGLKASEVQYRRLFEAAQDGILLLDAETGEITDVNPFLLDLLGYSHTEIMGKKLWEIGPFVDRAAAKQAFEKLQKDRYIRYENLPLETAMGTRIQVEFISNTYRVGDRDVMQCNIRDIAQRKLREDATEAALQAIDLKYRQLVENAGEAIFIVQGRHLVFANPMTSAMIGHSIEELMDRPFIEFIHPEDRDMLSERHRAWMGGEKAPSLSEFRVVRNDGEVRWLGLNGVVIRWQGEPAALDFVSDITELKDASDRLRTALEGTITAVARITEMRDPYTSGHQTRVTRLACAIAERMGLSEGMVEGLRVAGLLHDVGKVSVPAEILSKPSTLTSAEFSLVKGHAQTGYEILKDVDFPWPVAQIVLQHHERLDGSGYPQRLSNGNIRLEARILAVADVVEAMASHRPYRPALGISAALEEVREHRGKLYDSEVVEACIRAFGDGFELASVGLGSSA
jgi:PAS domain S-box-containing protein/putative nucleotidyltransferase with HDIG domain